ncbi:hypothetical protein GCM10010151_53580 [Actinoallomurus spadix]|uniref:Uncharacterized protein n=1 Tax=Actinoallomurus spadix TaxID=79912 RepID=A0ABN0X7M7_9ACTN
MAAWITPALLACHQVCLGPGLLVSPFPFPWDRGVADAAGVVPAAGAGDVAVGLVPAGVARILVEADEPPDRVGLVDDREAAELRVRRGPRAPLRGMSSSSAGPWPAVEGRAFGHGVSGTRAPVAIPTPTSTR